MRTAVLASGSGTILDAMADGGVPIDLVVVDRACGATDVADRHGVTWELVERTDFSKSFDRDGFTSQVVDVLRRSTTSSSS